MKATEEERSEAALGLLRRVGPPPKSGDDAAWSAAAIAELRADRSLADPLVYGKSARPGA